MRLQINGHLNQFEKPFSLNRVMWLGIPGPSFAPNASATFKTPATAYVSKPNILSNTARAVQGNLKSTYSAGTPILDALFPPAYASPATPSTSANGSPVNLDNINALLASVNQQPTVNPNPATGGQPAAPASGSSDFGSYLSSLYSQGRSALESIIPTYESDFNNYKNTVQDAVGRAKTTLDTGIADTGKRYGDSLKSLLQTGKELGQRTQNVFSGLGTLDSSAFGDELLKQQQADSQGVSTLDLQKNKDITGMNSAFDAYSNNANNDISSKQNELDRAKAAIRQQSAGNSLDEATNMFNLQSQLQNSKNGLISNLASAQAQGVDAIGALKTILGSGIDFNSLFGGNLLNRYNTGVSKLQIPANGTSSAGYIGASSGLTDAQRKLLGL